MEKKQMLWKTKGMNKDLSVSAFNPDFAFENMNLRLSTNEHNTLLSWVNEKGTEKIDLYTKVEGAYNPASIQGTPIGTAVIDHQLVVFTTSDNWDYIYTIHKEDAERMVLTQLYRGHLNFSTSNPLETLVSYEMDTVEKVYWVDGRNQPRVINIKGNIKNGVDTQFDFVPTLVLEEGLEVARNSEGSGLFAPGVIQYCFTYINSHGQETNVVAVSPLYYVSNSNRGARPDEMISTSFSISVNSIDPHFDFIRLYSIHRSSINGVPYVKLVAELKVESNTQNIQYNDNGTVGSTVDPQSLLFIGGKEITALTMSDKDKTLFLGNIEEKNSDVSKIQKFFDTNSYIPVYWIQESPNIIPRDAASGFYSYQSQLNNSRRQITTFKGGEIYRFGFQLQKKTGEWSEPILLGDRRSEIYPDSRVYRESIQLPYAKINIPLTSQLNGESITVIDTSVYKKIRPLIVYPTIGNRQVLCQGVLNPTVFNVEDRKQKLPFVQASWYFRPYLADEEDSYIPTQGIAGRHNPNRGAVFTHYTSLPGGFSDARAATNIEVQGAVKLYNSVFDVENPNFSSNNQFFVDQSIVTLNSPDIEFDTEVQNISLDGVKLRIVGAIPITGNASAHKIETSSGMVALGWNNGGDDSSYGTGEIDVNTLYNNINTKSGNRLISNFIWNDAHFKQEGNVDTPKTANYSHDFLIYPWQRTGPLNNDYRTQDKASSWLKKKMESNLLYSINTEYFVYRNIDNVEYSDLSVGIHLTENNFITNIRLPQQKSTLSNINYYPNVDKILHTEKGGENLQGYPIASHDNDPADYPYKWSTHHITALPISMKYKSTSHAILALNAPNESDEVITRVPILPYGIITENTNIGQIDTEMSGTTFWGDSTNGFSQNGIDIRFLFPKPEGSSNVYPRHNWLWLGELYRDIPNPFGTRDDRNAILANNWVVGGDAVDLPDTYDNNTTVTLKWTEGDTYFQRYDCLKTYAFTPEDTNQLVEILSFMVETHVNLDGRYDKNRGQQISYLMSPENFNLINDVYSQKDNFFSYKKADIDATSKKYPNQIAYTLTKTSGADVDAWTNMSLGSTLELDGDKGSITKLIKLNDKLLAFQDSGISQIMYNENVQVSTEQGVPIEIANSGKVQGARYLSNTVGCSNKWSVVQTPSGIYFMDSNDRSIYLLGDGIKNITEQGGFNTWAKQNISTYKIGEPLSAGAFKAFYDRLNQEVLYINKDTALAWSEKIGAFTSFYDYGNAPYFVNLDDEGYWLNISQAEPENTEYKLWKHQGGDYCNFFDVNKDYYTVLIGNPQPQADKIFTNLEFRACAGDGESQEQDSTLLPFDSLETWNEYQHGETKLHYNRMPEKHFQSNSNALNRKFRIWRCDIPRDGNRKLDRMRNPWLYLKLTKNKTDEGTLPRVEIHDVGMNYFV